MATDLFELVWAFHAADSSDIRRAVLVAMCTCILHLSQEYIVRTFIELDLTRFLIKTRTDDTDDDCRRLATAILNSTADGFSLF